VSGPVRFERGELTLTAPVTAAGELAGLLPLRHAQAPGCRREAAQPEHRLGMRS
jgi:hypothetical protein